MTNFMNRILAAATVWALSTVPALAFEPHPAEIGLQPAGSPSMVRLHDFYDTKLTPIIVGIVIFVFLLLVWVVLRYNKHANPVPSKTTHNVMLEVAWTVVPVLILILIAIPSYKLLFYLDRTATPDMTLKVTGFQWYWTYAYPEKEGLEVEARMIPEKEINDFIPENKGRRLLETYNPIVLPIEKNIQILTTANDVIHSWTIPGLGVKKDAVPGRTNEAWVRISEPGIYYGQCSEICGTDHAYMPISLYAVEDADYQAWIGCMTGTGDETKADYPSRACVQTLGFDAKYRINQKSHNVAQAGAAQ